MDDPNLRTLEEEIERLKTRLVEVEERSAARWRGRLARLGSSRRARLALVVAVVGVAAVSYAATISVLYTSSTKRAPMLSR